MQNDLISRVALLDAMPKKDELFSYDVRRVICDAPAVDAVEVVRCSECRHHDLSAAPEGMVYCFQWDICVSDGGFCHCGEMDGGAEDENT